MGFIAFCHRLNSPFPSSGHSTTRGMEVDPPSPPYLMVPKLPIPILPQHQTHDPQNQIEIEPAESIVHQPVIQWEKEKNETNKFLISPVLEGIKSNFRSHYEAHRNAPEPALVSLSRT